MAYGTPTDPVGGTVITVAYAVSNLLDPIRWLRLMTGNADPPGSSYVVVSSSTSATSWAKLPDDAMANQKVNRAGDVMSNTLTISSGVNLSLIASNGIQAGGNISTIGGNISAAGNVSGQNLSANSNVTAGGNISSTGGAVSAAGSVVATSQLISQVATGTPPIVVSSSTEVANLNAARLQGNAASAFAGAGHAHDGSYSAISHNHDGTYAKATSGTYTGNGAATQDIMVGFTPKFVMVYRPGAGVGIYLPNGSNRMALTFSNTIVEGSGSMISGGFQAVAGGNNDSGVTYYYVAIG
jgi:hypothetical protein